MVRASGQRCPADRSGAPGAPPGGKIAGGFVLVPVASLMAAWHACRSRPTRPADFRTWLAAREMLARRDGLDRSRRAAGPGRTPSYSAPELAGLLGVAEKRARASVGRLADAGLLEWSGHAIGFPDQALEDGGPASDTIGGGRGTLAIPRRMLRLLARDGRPALIATTLGVLLRCLSRRKAGFDGRGRVKASWVADLFGVDPRRVKAARKDLVALGWIEPEPTDQRAENRWGRAYRIDLAWGRAGAGGRGLPPLPADGRPAIATPSVDQEPLPERGEDQEPAGGGGPDGGTGVEASGRGARGGIARPDPPPVVPTPTRATPGPGPGEAPTLDDVRPEDLEDTGRLLELHRQAVARKLVGPSEADLLRVVSAAEHALAIGKGNPPGLFAHLVRGRCWRYLTGEDEDRAHSRLKAHSRLARGSGATAVPTSRGDDPGRGLVPRANGPSDDARIVREVRAACIRAGIYRDPWPAFQARDPTWDRGRWDRALAELGLS